MPRLGLGLGAQNTRKVGGGSPIPASGLSLWLKADVGVNYDGNDYVIDWEDQSGNNNNATIGTAGQEPVFISPFSNGKPAIEFDGQGQVMQITSSSSLNFTTTSAFTVLKYLGQGTANNIVYLKNSNDGAPTGAAMYALVGASESVVSFSLNVGGWGDRPTTIDLTNSDPALLSMTYNGTNQYVYLNGNFSDSFSRIGSIATSNGLLQIGGYNKSFGGAEYFYGQIAEIIMYNRAVTGSERQQIETYLNAKYAIY